MGFGATEALILLGIIVLLFGGKKLPELGSALGKSFTNFKKGMKGEDEKKSDEKIDNKSE